jgi:hypothetical protein
MAREIREIPLTTERLLAEHDLVATVANHEFQISFSAMPRRRAALFGLFHPKMNCPVQFVLVVQNHPMI